MGRLGSECQFRGLDPACGISTELPRKLSGNGEQGPQKALQSIIGLKHAKVFHQGSSVKITRGLLELNRSSLTCPMWWSDLRYFQVSSPGTLPYATRHLEPTQLIKQSTTLHSKCGTGKRLTGREHKTDCDDHWTRACWPTSYSFTHSLCLIVFTKDILIFSVQQHELLMALTHHFITCEHIFTFFVSTKIWINIYLKCLMQRKVGEEGRGRGMMI
jgi:hypothetical protein